MKGQASRTGAGGDVGARGIRGEWQEQTWGDLATLEYGKAMRGYRESEGSYRVYGTNGPIGWHDEPLCPHPGVIVGRKGAYRGIHFSPKPFFVIDTAFYLKPKCEFDIKWAYYELLTHDINSMDSGSAIPSTSRDSFYRLPVLIPPENEQRAIASILGELDDKIELNRQMNAALEAIGQAIFKHWFVDFEFPNEDGKPYRSSGGEMVDSELGAVPEGWEVTSIGDVVKVVGGGTPSTKNPAFWEGGTHHWTTPKDLSNISSPVLLDTARKITDAGLAKISSRLLPTGTFLLSSRAPVGYTAIAQVPLAVNQGYIAIPPTERLSSLFLLHWTRVNLETIKGRACGTTFQEISKKNFRPIKVAVPTPEILTRFDRTVGRLFERIVANEQESRALISIRDTLLPKLMSGEIRANSGEIKPAQ